MPPDIRNVIASGATLDVFRRGNPTRPRRFIWLLAVVALAVWVPASMCSNGEAGPDDATLFGALQQGQPIDEVDDETRYTATLVAEVLGTMVLDPLAQFPGNHFPFGEVYSGLVRVTDGSDGEVRADLASGWVVSNDRLRYTFTLREGLRFSDGSELTARDVKWSWDRALNPDYVTSQAVEVFGAVAGAGSVLGGESDSISGVTVIDDSTLTVDLLRPQSQFLDNLADPVASVLSQDNFENWGTLNWVKFGFREVFQDRGGLDFESLPVGTGPFRIEEFDRRNNRVLLTPNPFHWNGMVGDAAVVLESPGGVGTNSRPDIVVWGSARDDVRRVELQQDTGATSSYQVLRRQRTPRVSFFALNTSMAPLDDVAFRRALYHSIGAWDAGDITAESARDEAESLLPPGFPGHSTPAMPPERDLQNATHHFEASSYGPNLATLLEFIDDGATPDSGYGDFFESVSRYWVEWLGLEPTYVRDIDLPHGEFLRRTQAGTLQMRYVHVKPRYPDPCAILCRIPDLFGPNAQSDETRQLRAMLDDAAATADRAARIAKYQAIEAHILDRALVIPVFWDDGATYRLVKPYISGYKLPAYGGSQYEDVVVDTTHPEYPAERLMDAEGR